MTALLQAKARSFFEEDPVPEEFGWTAWLTPRHLRLFAGELHSAIAGGASDKEITTLVDEWIATAELDHSPEAQTMIERNRASTRFASTDPEWLKRRTTQ